MFMWKKGTPLDQIPDIGGKLMQWHVHDRVDGSLARVRRATAHVPQAALDVTRSKPAPSAAATASADRWIGVRSPTVFTQTSAPAPDEHAPNLVGEEHGVHAHERPDRAVGEREVVGVDRDAGTDDSIRTNIDGTRSVATTNPRPLRSRTLGSNRSARIFVPARRRPDLDDGRRRTGRRGRGRR